MAVWPCEAKFRPGPIRAQPNECRVAFLGTVRHSGVSSASERRKDFGSEGPPPDHHLSLNRTLRARLDAALHDHEPQSLAPAAAAAVTVTVADSIPVIAPSVRH